MRERYCILRSSTGGGLESFGAESASLLLELEELDPAWRRRTWPVSRRCARRWATSRRLTLQAGGSLNLQQLNARLLGNATTAGVSAQPEDIGVGLVRAPQQ